MEAPTSQFFKKTTSNNVNNSKIIEAEVKRGMTLQYILGTRTVGSEVFDGDIKYYGELVANYRHGKGLQIWRDGAIYMGQWKYHKADGIGKFKHSDADTYIGDFYNDRAYGYGIYKHTNGAVYEGFWVDDFQSGLGFEEWTDNSFFQGEYQRGKKQGVGKKIVKLKESICGEMGQVMKENGTKIH